MTNGAYETSGGTYYPPEMPCSHGILRSRQRCGLCDGWPRDVGPAQAQWMGINGMTPFELALLERLDRLIAALSREGDRVTRAQHRCGSSSGDAPQ